VRADAFDVWFLDSFCVGVERMDVGIEGFDSVDVIGAGAGSEDCASS